MKSVDDMTDEEVRQHAENVVRLAKTFPSRDSMVSVSPRLLRRLLDMLPPSWEALEQLRQGIG